jgi:cobalt/nickel transport protein
MKARTWLVWLTIVLLTVLPLWLVSAPPTAPGGVASAIFAGADDRAQRAIGDISPGYKPWFSPVFEPASDEIASLLFALQAAIGAGVIGFWLGMSVARERARRDAAPPHPESLHSAPPYAAPPHGESPNAAPPYAASPHGESLNAMPLQDHRAD